MSEQHNDGENVDRTLGRLMATMEALAQQIAQNEERAAASRRETARQLERIISDASETRRRTETLEGVMTDEVRPVVKSVVSWRSRVLGGMVVIGVVGTVVFGILTAAKDVLAEFVRAVVR